MANFIKSWKNYGKLDKAQKRQDIQAVLQLLRDTDDGYFIGDCNKVLGSFGVPATDQFLATLKSVTASDRWAATDALGVIGPQITDENLRRRVVIDLLKCTTDEVWSVRAGSVKALGSIYPYLENSDLKNRVTQSIQRSTRDENNTVRFYAKEALNQLGIVKEEEVAVPTPIYKQKAKASLKMENKRIPKVTWEYIDIILVDSSSLGNPGPGGSSFQAAIQSWNEQNFDAAASQFEGALRQGLGPLHQGYAYANLGTIMLMKDNLLKAINNYFEVFKFDQALYESVHDASQYLSIIFEQVGRLEESEMLKRLASQTQAKLGYSLSPSAITHVRRLVHESQIE